MKKTFLILLGISGALFLFQNCKHEPEEYILPDGDIKACDTSSVTFKASIEPILQTYCYSCHSGTDPEANIDLYNWEQFALIVQNGAFWGAINHDEGFVAMPQNLPKLSDCDLALISIWLRDTSWVDPEPSGKPCDPDTIYFQNDVLPLPQSSCAISGCHDPITAEDGIILNSYANVMLTGKIKPGDPGDSEIYEVIIDVDSSKRMPPPPASPLNSDQMEIISVWIEQGALNNYCDLSPCDSVNVTFSETITQTIEAAHEKRPI